MATHREILLLERRLTAALQQVDGWLNDHGLELAVHKTEATLLARRPPSAVQHLGIAVDRGITFRPHICTAAQ